MKIGVPFDVAWDMVDGDGQCFAEAMAWLVIAGEMEGEVFNWNRLEWERDPE